MKIAKNLLTLVAAILFSALFLCVSHSALAETPEDAVRQAIASMKSARSPVPMLEYVDWKVAYKKMTAKEKKSFGVYDPSQLKSFYKKLLTDPYAVVRKRIDNQLAAVPQSKRELIEPMIRRIEPELRQKQSIVQDRITYGEYHVGAAQVDDNFAIVPVILTYRGKTQYQDINMKKSGNRWLLNGN